MCTKNELEVYLVKAIAEQNQRRSAKSLGNRSLYIGASDIAGSFGCERRVVFNKLYPEIDRADAKSVISLERGHWVEEGIGKAIARKMSGGFMKGVRIDFTTEAGTPVQIHPDFVVLGKGKIVIFEVKSVKDIPSETRVEHQAQTQCQVSAIKNLWSQKAFSMQEIEKASFPMLASMALGKNFTLLPEIEGYVLYVSPDNLKLSDPITPDNAFWDVLQKKADSIWEKVQDASIEPQSARGIYPLCDYCAHIAECPNFASSKQVQGVKERVLFLKDSSAQQKEIEAEEDSVKDEVKAYAEASGFLGEWLEEDGYKIKVAMQPGRKSLNDDLLRQKLEQDYKLSSEAIDKLFADCTSFGNPFMRVNTHVPKDNSKESKKKASKKDTTAAVATDNSVSESAA